MKVAVLTATYERGALLKDLYESLLRNHQTSSSFHWYIMDDGSQDDTKSIVAKWIEEGIFEISYYEQENQGKMAAINHLMPYVTEEITIEVDSDDYLVDDAIETLIHDYETLEEGCYGILYHSVLLGKEEQIDPKLDGKVMPLYDMHYKYGYTFDMCLTFLTEKRKQYQYELVEEERFITEARTYYKMDQASRGLLIQTKPLKLCAYQPDGYTQNLNQMFLKYPKGYYQYFLELLNYPDGGILFQKRLYMVKQYILFATLAHHNYWECIRKIKPWKNRVLLILLYYPGKIMTNIRMR